MSVFVRGMEMPTKCADCNFCVNGFTDEAPMYECACQSDDMVSVLVDDNGEPFDFRPDWCPLTEVPEPHGDLIDRDALLGAIGERPYVSTGINDDDDEFDLGRSFQWSFDTDTIDKQPTIIKAEGERNENTY